MILPVIDENEIMMEKAKTRGEDTLSTKREKLLADIEKHRARIKGNFLKCSLLIGHYINFVQV